MPAARLSRVFQPTLMMALCLAAAFAATAALAQEATLDAPAAVAPSAEVSVRWSGPDAPGDFITISAPDARPEVYAAYARTSAGNPSTLPAPDIGEYEIRYVAAAGLKILARRPLSVRVVTGAAFLSAPEIAAAGTPFSVTVQAVGDPADYVTIVESGAHSDAFGPYARLNHGPTVEIEAPKAPGVYEIRQVQARDQTILASAPIEIAEPAPAVETAQPSPAPPTTTQPQAAPLVESAPETAPAAPETTDIPAERTATASAPEPPAPPAPATASLMALIAVDVGAEFHVAWTGPGASGDLIAIAVAGASDLLASAEAAGGAMVALTAPDAPGDYVLRYVAENGGVLAERELEVR